MAVLPKLIYRFSAIPVTIPVGSFAEMDELIPKFIWKCKGVRVAKAILGKKEQRGFRFPDFRTYYKVTVIKIVWFWHKDRHVKWS